MAEGQSFIQTLEEALEAKRAQLDRNEMARLKEGWKLFQVAFHGISSVLLKKGVIHEDPYKFDMKISDVANPPEGPFTETERVEQMSIRISQYEAYLDFLNNYYQFDTDFITLGRVKRLLGLVKYFNFVQLTETNAQPSTRGLAELCNMVKKGTDQLSSGIINEAISQLEKTSKEILAALKALSDFHRESYKLEVRLLVLPSVALDPALVAAKKDEAVRRIRAKFVELAGDRPFHAELVGEILDEDHSPNSEGLRSDLLVKLAVVEEKKTEKAQSKSYKGILLEGIRMLAGSSTQLEDAVTKLAGNSAVIEAADNGLMVQLRKMLKRLFGGSESAGVRYEVGMPDPVTGDRKPEEIDFTAFVEEGMRKARLLSSLLLRGGPTLKRLESAPDDHVFKFLERNIEELQRMIKRLNALDDHFKSVFPAEERAKFRGVKSEITTVKNCIIKANQKKHEYHAQMEEQQQLRRLGVKPD